MRYYDKKTGCEVINGVHTITADCIVLPDDHWFWHPLPPGLTVGQDEDGNPVQVKVAETDESRAQAERQWRDRELKRVAAILDQIRNDAQFGLRSYQGEHTPEDLNAYRVALCEYPASANFPRGPRPSL